MKYAHIKRKIKEADDIMLELNQYDKEYQTALKLFEALSQTAKYMKLYLEKKQSEGVELKHAEEELNEYMNQVA